MTHTAPPTVRTSELEHVIRVYSEVTERLKHSHDRLVCEVGRLQVQIAEKDRQLERRERLAALGEMAAGVAHEIRNPLGGIALYAGLLERDLQDAPDRRDLARRIRSGVQNLENIVADILAFARGSEPNLQEVRLEDILSRVLPQVQPQASARGVTVSQGDYAGMPVLRCDSRQIERALLNLIFNAIDAVAEGGMVRLDTRRRMREGVAFVEVVVEDDGPGIPLEHAHRIFNPFFTLKDTGTGLGLAIVHRIAEAHGGYVTGENRAEGGARFVLGISESTGDGSRAASCEDGAESERSNPVSERARRMAITG